MQEYVNDYNSDVGYIGAVFHCPNNIRQTGLPISAT